MLTIPHCKESLSRAYVTAVVGRARQNILWGREYDYGVDGTIREIEARGHRYVESGMGVDFQAKSTMDWAVNGDNIQYDLDAVAYNDLVGRASNRTMPFILILLCLHKEENLWLELTENELRLRNCIYWHHLDGQLTGNTATKRIFIPRSNLFNTHAVLRLLEISKTGVFPQ
jgi:hypothetical protein